MAKISERFAAQVLPLILLVATIALYFSFIMQYALNIPFQDGVVDFLKTMVFLDRADNFKDSASIFLAGYNDHQTTASRLLVYAVYLIQGEVNFQTLMAVANIGLTLILLLFYLRVQREELRWLWLLGAALVLLNLKNYSNIFFAQSAFPYFLCYLYSFAGIYVLHKVTLTRFVFALCFCALASFTFAAGYAIWILGGASLAHQSLVLKNRSLGYLSVWVLCACGALGLWILSDAGALALWSVGLGSEGVDEALIVGLAALPNSMSGGAPLTDLLVRYVMWFFVILGSAFSHDDAAIAIGAGVLLVSALTVFSVLAVRKGDIRLELCCWFVVASAAMVTLGRAKLFLPVQILNSRYCVISLLLVAAMVVLAQVGIKKRSVVGSWIVVMLAANYSYWTYLHFLPAVEDFHDDRVVTFNHAAYPVMGYSPQYTNGIVLEAIERGLYVPPCRPYPQCSASSGLWGTTPLRRDDSGRNGTNP